jgi:hypothetical protein
VEPFRRPLLIIFHGGFFFATYILFVTSIGRHDVEAALNQNGPNFIRNMLILMTLSFAGYLGLWFMQRWSLLLLAVTGGSLIAYGYSVGSVSIVNYLPLLAAITSLPFWPVMANGRLSPDKKP